MAGILYHLGRACSRHHWLVIGCWVLAAVGLALIARGVGDKTSDDLSLPGTESTAAQDVLRSRLPHQAYGTNPLALKAGSGKLTDSRNKQAIDETVSNLRAKKGVTSAINPLGAEGKAFLSSDGTIAYIPVTLSISPGRHHQGGGAGRPRRGQPGPPRGHGGGDRRLRRPAALQARHRVERGRSAWRRPW